METLVQLVALAVFVLGIGTAGFLLLRGMVRRRTLKRLESIGVPSRAKVVTVRDHRLLFGLEIGVGEDDSTSYFVVYEYDAVDKQGKMRHLSREEAISKAWFDRFSPGQDIPIHYLPSRPELARIDGNSWYVEV